MEILIVTQDFPPERGGIQTYMLELARAFLQAGHRVRVICPGARDAENPLPGLTDLVRLPVHSSWLFLRLIFFLPGYLRKNPGIDAVLYAQWQPALVEWRLAGREGKPRSYAVIHGRELLTSVWGPLAPWIMPRIFSRLDGAFPNSRAVRELAAGKLARNKLTPSDGNSSEGRSTPSAAAGLPAGPCPLTIIHPGVDPDRFHRVDAGFLRDRYGLGDAPVILSLTRMVARKNLRRLIEAMPAVLAQAPGTRLLLGGNGPERESLEARVRELGLSAQVTFIGRVADGEMAAHYSLADVFALPSLSQGNDIEGFGIVFLEAGACGTAVLGARAGGIPDAVADEETGLLVDPENSQNIEEALLRLLKNPAESRAMGLRGRQRVETEFTWKRCAEHFLAAMGQTG